MDRYPLYKREIETWQLLVHVCRRWRFVVFASPRRLNLQLGCTPGTPVRDRLDIWPALPLIVEADGTIYSKPVDNIVIALGHSDRVCRIDFRGVTRGLQWDKVLAAMQVPFPALTDLLLHFDDDETAPIIPDTFLGGSAPRLRYLQMDYAPFPGITNLALSATHLVSLNLSDIPRLGYISAEAMATCLSVLTNLDNLTLSFYDELLYLRPHRRPPPMTRSILPHLKRVWFKGANQYLDDLVARVDAPQLYDLSMAFPLEQMDFDTPHLVQFISRTPTFQEPNEAYVILDGLDSNVKLHSASATFCVEISYEDFEAKPQPSLIAQVCNMCFPPLPTVENLRVEVFIEDISEFDYNDPIEDDEWLELLLPFTAVKNLYLSKKSAPHIAAALQKLIGSRITEVLPGLQNILVEGLEPSGTLQEYIGQFITARQLSGHPIAVSDWHRWDPVHMELVLD